VTHYDYWQDKLMPNILTQSGADMLIYGMGEQPLRDILSLLKKGVPFSSLKTVKQVAFLQDSPVNFQKTKIGNHLNLLHEQCLNDKKRFARNFRFVETESNKQNARRLYQKLEIKHLSLILLIKS
jgi:radical SAM superfamily enzyme YgiQ (UPF0313 family)